MNAERLISSLIFGGLGRGRMPSKTKIALGLGAVGLVLGALEHYSSKQAGPPTASGPTPPPPPPGSPPPLPGSSPAGPPPLPYIPAVMPPPPPVGEAEALLLVRAMIAAAHADGRLDDAERRRIVGHLVTAGLGDEERQLVAREMETPADLDRLVAQVVSPQQAERVYVASLLAIDLDTPEEQAYLANLATRLGLDSATVARLHDTLGIPLP